VTGERVEFEAPLADDIQRLVEIHRGTETQRRLPTFPTQCVMPRRSSAPGHRAPPF
jgi:hypothetical protein